LKDDFINQGAPRQPEKYPFIVLGNKIDRETERQVSEEQVKSLLAKYPTMVHFYTSAKDSIGVDKAFEDIGRISIIKKP
jgi:Ras-related protein Rab-7A